MNLLLGDPVRVQDPQSKKWKRSGVIVEGRSTGSDALPTSFVIDFLDGGSGIRHKSQIWFDLKRECQMWFLCFFQW